MATIPETREWAAGEFVKSQQMNAVSDALDFLLVKPHVALYPSGNQTVVTGATGLDPVLFDTEALDPDGTHSTVSNTGRIVVVTPGVWVFRFGWRWQASTTNNVYTDMRINVNGSTIRARDVRPWLASSTHPGSQGSIVTDPIRLVEGDYVTAQAVHGGAGSVSLVGGVSNHTSFSGWLHGI